MRIIDLGTLNYHDAFQVQLQEHQAVVDGQVPALILVEHPPVITVSERRDAASHLLASQSLLAQLGIDVQPTDRGGDVTYHGPGQLVAYPIVPLARFNLNLGRYMRLLEQVVIDTVRLYRVEARREAGATGVWVDTLQLPPPRPHKLCAMGVRIRKNVTLHGLALNVTTNLSHFATIVPCGLADRGVTSLQQLLGPAVPGMGQVKADLAAQFRAHLRRCVEDVATGSAGGGL